MSYIQFNATNRIKTDAKRTPYPQHYLTHGQKKASPCFVQGRPESQAECYEEVPLVLQHQGGSYNCSSLAVQPGSHDNVAENSSAAE